METKLPSVSVIVATYNRADYLRINLACLAAQDYAGEWQIIVADDGSTDHTADVISEARSANSHLEIQHWTMIAYRRAIFLPRMPPILQRMPFTSAAFII